ncbi:MAG: hypothetical protein A3H31_03220 [Gallionellales bacterium RIFCSPLOWO2_02_FULL_57_47]|nr:MAG: hypothetical protein A3H31_03220 [Gallionellales bacterium RIFCSPLOWO2_02_FULL_57_47]
MINDGMLVLNDNACTQSQRTLIVLGAPRGGTSMVAGVLHHLGVYMGSDLLPTFEDPSLSTLMLQGRDEELKQAIIDRNQTHSDWGWKFPGQSVLEVLPKISGELRNPYFLVIYRDIFAIANRNSISAYGDLFENMKSALNYYTELGEFLASNKSPAMLISYEKVMLNPEVFVEKLRMFLGMGHEHQSNTIAFIEPNKPAYLRATDNRCNGFIDRVGAGYVAGWAYSKNQSLPVMVDVEVNGHLVQSVLADQYRSDVQTIVKHPNGKVGFKCALPPKCQLKPGDEIRVLIQTDSERKEINRSPWIFNEP